MQRETERERERERKREAKKRWFLFFAGHKVKLVPYKLISCGMLWQLGILDERGGVLGKSEVVLEG